MNEVTVSETAAARIAFLASLGSLVTLLVLHVVRPDLAPSRHMVSEYALGPSNWLTALYFLLLATGCAALLIALLSAVRTTGGRIGLGFLGCAAVGLVLAALFPMDPVGTLPDNGTTSGMMHGVAGALGMPTLIIASLILSYGLRRHPLWTAYARPLLIFAHLSWVSSVLMAVLIATAMQDNAIRPDAMFGWSNRLLVFAYAAWIMTAAWPLMLARRIVADGQL
ncbi:DUF998 domain-containing protein [Sphingosinicella sp.]|uniref:DUF998 domain-containing protein n=1 Tax=Sphingosinicella sp. TaxID=1917971 RepID=UPI004037B1C4